MPTAFESAIIAAVNDTKDNDTIAAIVGCNSWVPLHGKQSIRTEVDRRYWFQRLEDPRVGRREDHDVMISMACQAARGLSRLTRSVR